MNPSRLLTGTTTLVTRAREQARDLQRLIESQGGRALVQPGIEILPPVDWTDFDAKARQIHEGKFDWVVFSSANGARFAVDRLRSLFPSYDAPTLFSRVQLAAVGSGTRDALVNLGLEVSLFPDRFDAEGLVDALVARMGEGLQGKRFLSFRANRGRKVLSEHLNALGAEVVEVEAYRNVDATEIDPSIELALRSGTVDFATVASSATAKAIVKLLGENARKTRWIAISPLTADALHQVGIEPSGIARVASMEGLVEALVEARQKQEL